MQALRRPKVRDQAAEHIKQHIIRHKLAPGDRLPTETHLAEKLGISRPSLREATKALEFLGIVESKTGVGLTVGRIDMGRVTGHLGFHSGLLDVDPLQLIDSRVIVETGVLAHVARRMKEEPGIEEGLRALAGRFGSARDLHEFIALDIQFHRSLLEASGLQPIVAFGDLLHVFFQRFRESLERADWTRGVDSHLRILDHLAKNDPGSASDELRKHIESHKARLS